MRNGMKFISWNVNGLRACAGKGFDEVFNTLDADFFCLQETKMQPGQTSRLSVVTRPMGWPSVKPSGARPFKSRSAAIFSIINLLIRK